MESFIQKLIAQIIFELDFESIHSDDINIETMAVLELKWFQPDDSDPDSTYLYVDAVYDQASTSD